MAYLALYRKYRPRTFDDVISQEHITTTLKNQLKNGQSSHAYLFTGSRGTGKTTCAKILAKALNCTNLQDGNPCLECDICKSIDEDYSDITEIDAASNNGVGDVRDLKEESFYAPMSGKYKVYIIDEVHMLSTAAFNALLKLIEEPPAHVVFILATTEVHKVPATILSRCQRFEFRRIDINDSKARLLHVAELEGKKLTDDAAFLISKISEGGMRDALSLLDQCFSLSDEVTADIVRECAGISGSGYLFSIAELILAENSADLLITLDELISKSKDVTRLCEELISHYRCLMLIKAGADALTVRVTADDMEQYKEQCGRYSLEQIMRCLSILSDTLSSMGRVKTPALLLEMCFIKLCTPSLDTDENSINVRLESLERKISEAPVYYNSISGEQPEKTPAAKRPAEKQKAAFIPPVSDDIPTTPVVSDSSALAPLTIWNDIVESLPMEIQLGIDGTTAFISGDNVIIDGGNLAVTAATKDYRETIQKVLSARLGRNVAVLSKGAAGLPDTGKQEKPDKVRIFIDLARSKGITIKEK
ncbi:MAG: DNA polymerase III subunit gamma/tau [Ruminiclostridium sp.]|nr:DNA polymerase III subunit gamma/tau [Ruminiclostridium sp.]